jgi:transcriptional regulator with PAS, ATPase and Fis domain
MIFAEQSINELSVVDLMNKNFTTIKPTDTFKAIINIYKQYKIDIIPVVDAEDRLVGVFPRGKLYNALLDGKSLNDPCMDYIVLSPTTIQSELNYNDITLSGRVNNSKVGTLPIVDHNNNVLGIAGPREYLRTTIKFTMKTNAFLQSVIQAMHDAIITTDRRGNILMINQAAEKMFSVSEKDITGKFIQDVFPSIFFRNKLQLGISTVLHSVPVILNQVPIIEAGELVGMNFVLQDKSKLEEIATELEVVKELQQNFNGVLSASSDGVFVVDQNGVVKYSNDMANTLVDTAAPGANIEKL